MYTKEGITYSLSEDKCPHVSMKRTEFRFREIDAMTKDLRILPPETKLSDYEQGDFITVTAQDCLELYENEKELNELYKEIVTPFLDLCEGCTDPFYLNGFGFGREDCPVKKKLAEEYEKSEDDTD